MGLDHRYYKFSRTLRVDGGGQADFVTVKDACDAAALITPRDFLNTVRILVNDGAYYENPFTIPAYTILSLRAAPSESSAPGALILRQDPSPSETAFVTMDTESVMVGISVIVNPLPANFDTTYAAVLATGAGAEISRCSLSTGNYVGANRINTLKAEGLGVVLERSRAGGAGAGTTVIETDDDLGIYYCWLAGNPGTMLRVNNEETSIHFTRMRSRPQAGFQASVYDAFVDGPGQLFIYSTRIPFDRRGGTGLFTEVSPTPKQLFTARKAIVRTVAFADPAGDRLMDSYADGTLCADTNGGAFPVTLPPVADAIVGEIFAVTNTGTSVNDVTVSGDATINGGASLVIPDGVSRSFQKTDGNVWWTI